MCVWYPHNISLCYSSNSDNDNDNIYNNNNNDNDNNKCNDNNIIYTLSLSLIYAVCMYVSRYIYIMCVWYNNIVCMIYDI